MRCHLSLRAGVRTGAGPYPPSVRTGDFPKKGGSITVRDRHRGKVGKAVTPRSGMTERAVPSVSSTRQLLPALYLINLRILLDNSRFVP